MPLSRKPNSPAVNGRQAEVEVEKERELRVEQQQCRRSRSPSRLAGCWTITVVGGASRPVFPSHVEQDRRASKATTTEEPNFQCSVARAHAVTSHAHVPPGVCRTYRRLGRLGHRQTADSLSGRGAQRPGS